MTPQEIIRISLFEMLSRAINSEVSRPLFTPDVSGDVFGSHRFVRELDEDGLDE